MAKRGRIINLDDGDAISIVSGQHFYLSCCDCLLNHRVNIHTVGREVELKFTRDERRTSQQRRRFRERR